MTDVPVQEALADALGIAVITYNRAPYLERTLEALMNGPFCKAGITILDNCSTDATPQVCERYVARNSNVRVVRHPRNIGAVGNVLSAMELANCKYSWLLCDDDILDFSACDDFVEALLSGRFDLMIVGGPGRLPFDWGRQSTFRTLFEHNPGLFHVLSFLPSMIFRSSQLDGVTLQEAYLIGGDMFPQLAIAGSMLVDDVDVFTVRQPIVKQDYADPYWWTQLEIFAHWVRTCRRVLPAASERRQVIYEMACNGGYEYGPSIFLAHVMKAIALEKAQGALIKRNGGAYRQTVAEYFIQIFSGCTWDQRLLLILCLPILLVPGTFYMHLRNAYRWLKYTARGKSAPAAIPPQSLFAREPVKSVSDVER